MSDVFHVRPYLMRSTGFEIALHQRHIAQWLKCFEMCNGMSADVAFRECDGYTSVLGAATKMNVNCAIRWVGHTPHQCIIRALNGVMKKLLCQGGHSRFGFGNHQQPRSVFINAM